MRPVRLPPQPEESWTEETRAILGGRRLHLPAVVAWHPTFLEPYMAWASAVAQHGVLTPRDNALLALRTALRCGSDFEWGVHAVRGMFPSEEIARVAAGAGAGWSDREALLLRAADELHDQAAIGETTWTELSATFPTEALLEIVFVVGHYTMLSMVANSAGVEPEPDWPRLPEG